MAKAPRPEMYGVSKLYRCDQQLIAVSIAKEGWEPVVAHLKQFYQEVVPVEDVDIWLFWTPWDRFRNALWNFRWRWFNTVDGRLRWCNPRFLKHQYDLWCVRTGRTRWGD